MHVCMPALDTTAHANEVQYILNGYGGEYSSIHPTKEIVTWQKLRSSPKNDGVC